MTTETNLIYKQISLALDDLKAIGKNQKNSMQGFKFRGIDDIYNNLHDIFSKHQIFTVPEILDDKTEERQTRNGGNLIYRILKVKYTVFATDGSSISGIVIGEGMDSGDKAANKAMSIAHKYFLTQLLCIPFEDIAEPDSETHEVIAKRTAYSTSFNVEDRVKELQRCDNLENLAETYKKIITLANKIGLPKYETDKIVIAKDTMKHKLGSSEQSE